MDIVSLPIEMDKELMDSRFRIVAAASQRARELAFGAKSKVPTRSKKITTIALEETIQGKLEYLVGDEARKQLEEANKFDYKRFLEEKRKEAMPEDLSELERDLKVYLHEREGSGSDRNMLEELFSDQQQEPEAEAEDEEQS